MNDINKLQEIMDRKALDDWQKGICPFCGSSAPGDIPSAGKTDETLKMIVDGVKRDPMAQSLVILLSSFPSMKQEELARLFGCRRQLIAAAIPRAKALAPGLADMIRNARTVVPPMARKRISRAKKRAGDTPELPPLVGSSAPQKRKQVSPESRFSPGEGVGKNARAD